MNINTILQELKNYLAGTREYAALKYAASILSNNPASSGLVSAFQKKQEATYAQNLPEETMHRLFNELEQDYASIRKYKEVSAYFDAMEQYNQMFDNLIGTLNNSVIKDLHNNFM